MSTFMQLVHKRLGEDDDEDSVALRDPSLEVRRWAAKNSSRFRVSLQYLPQNGRVVVQGQPENLQDFFQALVDFDPDAIDSVVGARKDTWYNRLALRLRQRLRRI